MNKVYRNVMAKYLVAGLLSVTVGTAVQAEAPKVEVLHFWTSGGEAAAMKLLRNAFEQNGGDWADMAVAGGGGDAAQQVLRARVLSGNPPAVVQMKAPEIQEWHAEGVLADITDVAKKDEWEAGLSGTLVEMVKCGDAFCAVPVNIHRVDNLYANKRILEDRGISMPRTWDEFNQAADQLMADGIIPLAHGGQAWQDTVLFENVLMGVGGADLYRRAFVELDDASLRGEDMQRVFDQMRVLVGYIDDGSPGRDWNIATGMVVNGQAAFQVMGDWAKGEFLSLDQEPGKDFLCASAPGEGYILNVNSLAMFDVSGDADIAGQKLLASLTMGHEFQIAFAKAKGSIPARTDVSLEGFDECALLSAKDLGEYDKSGSALPSLAVGVAQPGIFKGAIVDVITQHFNSDMSSEEAAAKMADAVNAVRN